MSRMDESPHTSGPDWMAVYAGEVRLTFPDDRPDICTPCLEDRHDRCPGCRCNSSYHKLEE